MEQLKVFTFLEENMDYLFPNKEYSEAQVENALLSAPESFEARMTSFPFRSPSAFYKLSLSPLGWLGLDHWYLEDKKGAVKKYFSFSGLGRWWRKDTKAAKERCRTYNCKKFMDSINNPAVIQEMQRIDGKVDKMKKMLPVLRDLTKATIKGVKDIQDTMYVR